MRTSIFPTALLLLATAGTASAATVDLTGFSFMTGTNSSASMSAGLITLGGTATASGNVTNLGSFDWNFTGESVYVMNELNDYSFFTISTGTYELADVASVYGGTGTTGLRTYSFATPYSGAISFSVANRYDNDDEPSTLEISNLLTTRVSPVSPVPEPGSLGMLLAGMGIVGALARRRRPETATV